MTTELRLSHNVVLVAIATLFAGCYNLDTKNVDGSDYPAGPDAGVEESTRGVDGATSVPMDGALGSVDSGGSGRLDVAGIDVSLMIDGPVLDTSADFPQSLPDSSDTYVIDASADSPVIGIDGNAGTGGTVGSGGAVGTGGVTGTGGTVSSGGTVGSGGATGTGGGSGVCGSRDCTSDKDNDCNGTADNQEASCKRCTLDERQACSTGALGVCAAGTQTCQLASNRQSVDWGACLQNVPKGSRDCTSSNDNDCNGQADYTETTFCQCPSDTSFQACSTGLKGICAAGSSPCVMSGNKSTSTWGACVQTTPKGTETCANPGTDDDCDGTTDNIPATCNVLGKNVGACANGGTTYCNGTTQECTPLDPKIGTETSSTSAAPNGSWDWNCDGSLTKTYPDTASPPSCDGLDINSCGSVAEVRSAYNAPIACGETDTISRAYCSWNTTFCMLFRTSETGVTQGCY